VIRLDASAGDHRGSPKAESFGHHQLEFADLVPTKSEGNRVIPLDEDRIGGTSRGLEPFQSLDGGRSPQQQGAGEGSEALFGWGRAHSPWQSTKPAPVFAGPRRRECL